MKPLDVQDENYVPEYANSDELQDWIFNNLPEGSKILEFGSGYGTIKLAEQYEVTSVEDNEEWLYLAQNNTYIYAPLVNDWYDWQALDILKNDIIPSSNVFCYGQVESRYGSGQFFKDLNTCFKEDSEEVILSKIKNKEAILDSIKDFLGKGK